MKCALCLLNKILVNTKSAQKVTIFHKHTKNCSSSNCCTLTEATLSSKPCAFSVHSCHKYNTTEHCVIQCSQLFLCHTIWQLVLQCLLPLRILFSIYMYCTQLINILLGWKIHACPCEAQYSRMLELPLWMFCHQESGWKQTRLGWTW